MSGGARAELQWDDSSNKPKFRGDAAPALRADNHLGRTMKNPLDSLWGTVISGLILTAVLYAVVRSILV
jgi:hypothetical protein